MKGMIPLEQVFETKKHRPLGEFDRLRFPGKTYQLLSVSCSEMKLARLGPEGNRGCPIQRVANAAALTAAEADGITVGAHGGIRQSDGVTVADIYAEQEEYKVGAGDWLLQGQTRVLREVSHVQNGRVWFMSADCRVELEVLAFHDWLLITNHETLVRLFREATAGAFND